MLAKGPLRAVSLAQKLIMSTRSRIRAAAPAPASIAALHGLKFMHIQQSETQTPKSNAGYSISARFEELPLDERITVGSRVDAVLRQCYQICATGEQQSELIPIASLHKWARLKLLRIRSSSVLPSREHLCSYRLTPGDKILLHRDIAAKLIPVAASKDVESNGGSSVAPSWLTEQRIVHVDEHFVAISKPAGVPVQGGSGISHGATIDAVLPAILSMARDKAVIKTGHSKLKRMKGNPIDTSAIHGAGSGDDGRLRLVHRLDRDVSGLLLLARGKNAAWKLTSAFKDGTIQKTYAAIVTAPLPEGTPLQGTIAVPVVNAEYLPGKDGKLVAKEAEEAETRYTAHVLTKSVPATADNEKHAPPAITLLYLEPLTGRKHQLRQHVLHLFKGSAGILGDPRYHGAIPPEMRRALGLPAASKGAALLKAPRGTGGQIALHSLKAVIPAGLFDDRLPVPPQPLLLKDAAGVPAWMSALLREYGWQLA